MEKNESLFFFSSVTLKKCCPGRCSSFAYSYSLSLSLMRTPAPSITHCTVNPLYNWTIKKMAQLSSLSHVHETRCVKIQREMFAKFISDSDFLGTCNAPFNFIAYFNLFQLKAFTSECEFSSDCTNSPVFSSHQQLKSARRLEFFKQ